MDEDVWTLTKANGPFKNKERGKEKRTMQVPVSSFGAYWNPPMSPPAPKPMRENVPITHFVEIHLETYRGHIISDLRLVPPRGGEP